MLEPVAVAVARPFVPGALLMAATLVLNDDQVTVVVMFCVPASL